MVFFLLLFVGKLIMNMHWGDFVAEKTRSHGEFVLGIDPVYGDIPVVFKKDAVSETEAVRTYVQFLLDTIYDQIGFVKFQSAFFEAFGSKGVEVLARCIAYGKKKGLGIILDAKRGDIGSTASAYADAYLRPKDAGSLSDLEVDCMTINPFLGPETLEPFVDCARKYGKGLFVLVKTSNPGAGWLQDKLIDGACVSDRVAKLVYDWAAETKGSFGLSSVGAVIGATFPEDGKRLRKLMPDSIMLAPGLGAQNGKPEDISVLRRPDISGVLVPVSRGVTKTDNLAISLDAYATLINERVSGFQLSLR